MATYKVIITGNFGVGKSSIFNNYIHNRFSDKYLTTIGVKVNLKKIKYDDNEVSLVIWDIAGEVQQSKTPVSYFLGVSCIIYVFDLSRPLTHSDILSDIEYLKELTGNVVKIIVVGNKLDLLNAEEIKEIKNSIEHPWDFITSAKTGKNIINLFEHIGIRFTDTNNTNLNYLSSNQLHLYSTEELLQYLYRNKKDYKEYFNILRPINEGRVIFLGSGNVGKTSIINRIVHNKFNNDEKITENLNLSELVISRTKSIFTIKFWDFAGQETFHEIHKLFFSDNTTYVVVTDARLGDKIYSDLDYWLNLIKIYASESPVIIVVNKTDAYKINMSFHEMKKEFQQITDIIETSCKDNLGLAYLKKKITSQVIKINNDSIKLPLYFFYVQNKIKKIKSPFVDLSSFENKILKDSINLNKQDVFSILKILTQLGIIFHFPENKNLKNYIIVKPLWIYKTIFNIVSLPLIKKNNGFVSKDVLLNSLYEELELSPEQSDLILELMMHFELVHFSKFNKNIVIPLAFSSEKPKFPKSKDNSASLNILYQYEFAPNHIISRFIIRNYYLIINNLAWKQGLVIYHEIEDNTAKVTFNSLNKNILIEVSGDGNKRRTLSFIRTEFSIIHKSMPKIKVEEKVPIEGEENIFVNYEDLISLENMGENKIIIPSIRKKFDVKELLEGIEEKFNKLQLKKIISNGEFEKAIRILKDKFPYNNEVIIQTSKFEILWYKIRLGIYDSKEESVETSKLTLNMLNLIDILK